MAIASNSIKFRRIRRRIVEPAGYNYIDGFQVSTKDITSSVLGLIPLSSTWSAWKDIDMDTIVYIDENDNEITP